MSPHCPTQPHFNKLMRRKWLNSSEALDGIVGALGAKALALRRMQDEPYQVCMGEGWGGARRRGRGGGRGRSQSSRQGETLSRCGGGCPQVPGCRAGCRQDGGLCEVELRERGGGCAGASFRGR